MSAVLVKKIVCIDDDQFSLLKTTLSDTLYLVRNKSDRIIPYYKNNNGEMVPVTNLTYENRGVPQSLCIDKGVLYYIDENLVRYPILDSTVISVKISGTVAEISLRSGEVVRVASRLNKNDEEYVIREISPLVDFRPDWGKF